MAQFYALEVADIQPETRDAVVVTLKPSQSDAEKFDFIPGQYLTFRQDFDGQELRRSYSICSTKADDALKVGIKRVEGGCFSNWANDELKVGDTVEVMSPQGNFKRPSEENDENHYLLFAGGSGITPVLSILKSLLTENDKTTVTLVYGNRSVNTIMFREELENLKNRFMTRLSIVHILENEAEIDLFAGRMDEEKCDALFRSWVNVPTAKMAFICGPEPMMLAISSSLQKHGMDKDKIKFELFASAQPGRAAKPSLKKVDGASENVAKTSIIIDGSTRDTDIIKGEQTILDAALAVDMHAPYACKAGVCSTCRCKVVEGDVEMVANHALEDYEVRAGYVLSCQTYPLSDKVVVDYDV